MHPTQALALACLLLASGHAGAAEAGAPQGLTVAARPSYRSGPTQEQADSARRYDASGRGFLATGQPGRAVTAFKNAVRLEPDAENFKALGLAETQAGDPFKAAWAYRESLRLKPDPGVEALAQALADPAGPSNKARYRSLMGRAAEESAQGRSGPALDDYEAAYAVWPGPESAGPALRLSADAVEVFLGRKQLDRAVEILCRAERLRGTAGFDGKSGAYWARLDLAKKRVERWSGMNLRDNQKAMLADRSAWARALRDRASAGEPGA